MLFDKCVCNQMGSVSTLTGGFIACLCPDCSNAWGEYIRKTTAYEEYHLNVRLLERAINAQANGLRALNKRDIELYTHLYYMAKKWVGERRVELARDDNI